MLILPDPAEDFILLKSTESLFLHSCSSFSLPSRTRTDGIPRNAGPKLVERVNRDERELGGRSSMAALALSGRGEGGE